ncbi:MAG: carbonic anhydrase family protein [Gammaproteobacteria bacterium]|nr:carbonic anhydrase family protein [Gammaproteobacteria bacterium]
MPRSLAVLSFVLLPALGLASDGPHWSYEGEEGPAHWAGLDEHFAVCGSGKEQSPVDIQATEDTDLPALAPRYAYARGEIVHNGHTIQVNVPVGGSLEYGGRQYQFKQFHFHAPSENRIQGKSFPLEVHLVHADAEGHLAVIGALYQEGAESAALKPLWETMPKEGGEKAELELAVNPERLLPAGRDYYRFPGSLTTPPCSEGVQWLLLKQPVSASAEQLKQFKDLFEHGNARPVQPLHGRVVEE